MVRVNMEGVNECVLQGCRMLQNLKDRAEFEKVEDLSEICPFSSSFYRVFNFSDILMDLMQDHWGVGSITHLLIPLFPLLLLIPPSEIQIFYPAILAYSTI